jgi:hypothetical protein
MIETRADQNPRKPSAFKWCCRGAWWLFAVQLAASGWAFMNYDVQVRFVPREPLLVLSPSIDEGVLLAAEDAAQRALPKQVKGK